ncbi:MAG: lysylphosphatidylglycerol synthase transmembrane domain-containing protein [Pararhodobacter sp.]
MNPLPRWLAPVLRLCVAVALMALILRFLGVEQVLTQLRRTSPLWLAVAVALLSVQVILSALRWRLTATTLGLQVSRRQAVREYYLSVLGNTVLPGGVLGDMGRILRFRHQAGLARAAETVVIERLAGQVAIFGVLALGAVVWFWPTPAAMAGAVALPVTLAGLALAIRRAGQGGWRPLRLLRNAWAGPEVWRRQLGLSLLIVTVNLAGFWAAAQAVGLTLGFAAAIFALPLALVAMIVPVTINGWGLREGMAAALWPLVGASATGAVAASVVFGLAALLAALPGLLALRPAPLNS